MRAFVWPKENSKAPLLSCSFAQPPFCCANCSPIVWSCRGCCVVSFVIWASTDGVRQRWVGSVERFWRVGLVCDSVGHHCRLALHARQFSGTSSCAVLGEPFVDRLLVDCTGRIRCCGHVMSHEFVLQYTSTKPVPHHSSTVNQSLLYCLQYHRNTGQIYSNDGTGTKQTIAPVLNCY